MTDKETRGFASMDDEKQREIASKGGKAAHEKGTAHEFTPDEARAAGHKGGEVAHGKGTAHEFSSQEAREAGHKGGEAVSRDREHMAEIGREGGEHSHGSHSSHTTHTSGTRGGTREQHREAGKQSHKQDR
jgi:general stress protein YciG